jgi:hypothetical protein
MPPTSWGRRCSKNTVFALSRFLLRSVTERAKAAGNIARLVEILEEDHEVALTNVASSFYYYDLLTKTVLPH